jgi:hypothetical protein
MIAVVAVADLRGTLAPDEEACLARRDLVPERRRRWIAGRLAVRQLLGPAARVVSDERGAPVLVGIPGHVSLSYDGPWIAVGYAAAPIGVDLCLREHRPRLARALLRFGIAGDAVRAWAAMEAFVKRFGAPPVSASEALAATRTLETDAYVVAWSC